MTFPHHVVRFVTTILMAMFFVVAVPENHASAEQVKLVLKPVPAHLQGCLDNVIKQLMLTNQNDRRRIKTLFLANIDTYRLGARAVGGGAWKNASADWRDKALDLYFTLIYDKGSRVTAGMKNAANTVILSHLADRPEVTGNGLWHVVMQVTLDNHQSFAVAVLLTDKCRVFDFAQGTWTSTFLDAVDVDLAMKM